MPPDRGRASKACATCRKIKTRCYESYVLGNPCLRCERLGQSCSLESLSFTNKHLTNHAAGSTSTTDERLNRLEETVAALVTRVDLQQTGGDVPARPYPLASSTSPAVARTGADIASTPSSAPVLVIRDVASQVGLSRDIEHLSPPMIQAAEGSDIIAKGIFTFQEAIELIRLSVKPLAVLNSCFTCRFVDTNRFQEHYGRWVAFNEAISPETLLLSIRTSPLLLCACCLIAVRHMPQEETMDVAPLLFREAKGLLLSTMLEVPQSLQFFQAAVVLSLWSTTIGQTPLSIDGWLLSGFAIQHSLASDVFEEISAGHALNSLTKSQLDHRNILNNLCLGHLHYCVGTRRRSILDFQQVNACREILKSDQVTNYQTRMVAEIYLYWIIYQNCLQPQVDLPAVQASLYEWKQEWKFLFEQPRSQFIQMGFHFAQLLAYDQALKSRSAAVRESLLSEMLRLSAAIIQLSLDTSDSRTRHLSDHIYHMITFAAVTLCRLLHMYENQIAATHNLAELDALVLTLVNWLQSIGLSCHIAHTLGDVVSAFHEKLRPNAHPGPYGQAQDDIGLYFPELLGVETYDDGNFDYVPQWEPFNQGSA